MKPIKIIHDSETDYVSIDFKDTVEAKSYFTNGIIVREDKKGQVIGIDITDSSNFFSGKDTIDFKQACKLLGLSASTLRRRIKKGGIQYTKPNGKDYRFKKSDLLGLSS
ncbi:excisionase family DNA-binding protein [bacterium]|nr:excisionase family DNA-binding protein [bacterium]